MIRMGLDSLILLTIPWMVYRVTVLVVKQQLSLKIELIKALFYFSVIFIYSLTLFPFPFSTHMVKGNPLQLMNLTPFATILSNLTQLDFDYMDSLRNLAGNILLFMPLGFSIPLRFKLNRPGKVILLGFLTSFLVEVIQFFTFIRSFDVDDLMLNTLGASLGFVLYRLFHKFRTRLK
ncbi:hypothetical protein AWM70_12220 [Paenibacillus yonginensis]|uniref:VanZ-like domain-containing protein n=1 Tax=Paenibacillus yonginensis TaxID=1462996 RepID=A0A1B1N1G1_9BACL|nr:VanZ family protein [Paenibacillus yonginensis]ANS75274.1 hypothetical protein AWM70_12220 [Paenibacillus yonginensis]